MTDVKTEIESTQRAERRKIREDAELFEGLLKHPGWSRYLALVEAVGQNQYTILMSPMANVFEATKHEHAKGTLYGLTLATSLPSAKIREASELTRQPEDE